MGNRAYEYLVDWVLDYLRNRDLLFKKIEIIEKNKDGFDVYVKFNDSLKSEISNSYESPIRKKEQFFIVKPLIENVDEVLSKFDSERHFGLVVLNTLSNFNALAKEWNKFAAIKNLCVYFVNPYSISDKKWIIYPYTHNNICEKNSLERGLRSMFEMVAPLTEKEIEDKFK